MKSLLFYHVYLVNNWRQVSNELLSEIPQDEVFINLSFDLRYVFKVIPALLYFKRIKKVKKVYLTQNHASFGEILSVEKFLNSTDLTKYGVLTYIHSKGVTKFGRAEIDDWREVMRYFVMSKYSRCQEVFKRGYYLYGVNLMERDFEKKREHTGVHTDYWYRGNFVSVNLEYLAKKLNNIDFPIRDYYSIEGLWGRLCDVEKAYCVHDSGISHYKERYPEELYKK